MSSPIQKRRIESELHIFEMFRSCNTKGILFATDKKPEDCPEFAAFAAAFGGDMKLWMDTSGKADKTPDLFSLEYETMIELMRVDDHAFVNENGKVINHAASADSKRFKELVDRGFLETYPNASIIITGDTGLPTLEDHNYQRYKANFERVVKDHISKIPTYRNNHPECKYLIFLIFDESCGYFEAETVPKEFKKGMMCRGRPHLWPLDENLVNVFSGSDVDCVIWFTPYKYAESRFFPEGLPIVSVFFKSEGRWRIIRYDESHMVPAEE